MRTIVTALLLSGLLALAGCGSQTVFTPEFVDPSTGGASLPAASSAPVESASPSSSESASEPEASQPSSAPAGSETVPCRINEELSDPYTEGDFTFQNYQMRCDAGDFTDSGRLDYCLVQLAEDHPAAQRFNAYYQKDLSEWKNSVQSTARDEAALALAEGLSPERYQVSLPAAVWQGGGVISVTRSGVQIQGENPAFPFMMNECFDGQTGEQLTLWSLFSADRDTVSHRLTAALQERAQDESAAAEQGLAASAWQEIAGYFAPADFSLSAEGFTFYLLAPQLLLQPENRLIQLTIPYEAVADILSYPLAGE